MEAAGAGRAAPAVIPASVPKPRSRPADMAAAVSFLAPSLVVFAIFVYWPLVRRLYLSVHANDIIGRPTLFVGADQHRVMLTSPTLPGSSLNSWSSPRAWLTGTPIPATSRSPRQPQIDQYDQAVGAK
ncbi:MAG TPA: hypothetical protein VF134_01330 [Candidatus Dormibacteraeota bacterium]